MARDLLEQAGFAGEPLNIMLGVEWIECMDPYEATCTCHPELPPRKGLHYYDAVGDTTLVTDKWGPSIGAAQIRSLRHPELYPFPDTLRIASELRDPWYNANAAWEISRRGTYFEPWSAYKSGSYLPHVGEDFELHAAHRNAHLWNI